MNKEEFLKLIDGIPKTKTNNFVSAYNSIDVDDLAKAVERFKKVPTYKELLKENQQLKDKNNKYKEVIDKIKNILNNQMNYREFVDIVNAIEDVVKEVE